MWLGVYADGPATALGLQENGSVRLMDHPAPTRLDEVLDPAWLGPMLGTRWPGAEVMGVEVVETLVTQATKVRLALRVAGGGEDMPARICIKGILTPTGAPSVASVVETRFYRDLAGLLDVRVPDCIYAALNDAGDNGVIVMRDVIAGGGSFCSALTPFTPDEARQSVEQLAVLHARTWRGTALYETGGIASFLDQITRRPIIRADVLQALLDGARGETLAPAIRDAGRLQRALELYAADVRNAPTCLVHGDAHAGNIYRDGGGFGLVDWQILQTGEWAQDVAYHFAAVLTPEDRRMHERALLDHYLGRLAALGGPRIALEDAWARYRPAMIYGYYLWAMTRTVDADIVNEFVRRLGIAATDLRSFELVGA